MMRYEEPTMEFIEFEQKEVITTSLTNGKNNSNWNGTDWEELF